MSTFIILINIKCGKKEIVLYNIAICDDEMATCHEIEQMLMESSLQREVGFNIEIFYSGEKLIENLRTGRKYDFVILDIMLEQVSGVDVGRYLRDDSHNFHTQIIFISSKETYAMQLFSVQPLDFLVKPVKAEALLRAIRRGAEILTDSREFFTYKSGRENISLSCNEILYFYSDKRVINIVCSSETVQYYGKLSDEVGRLPECFVQIHKSYVINVNAVRKSGNSYVIMNNGEQINISRAYADTFKNAMLARWRRYKEEIADGI
jgi:DNA-binding LytR/AlgR family response regulator